MTLLTPEQNKIIALMSKLGYELSKSSWSDGKLHIENEEFQQIIIKDFVDSQDGGDIPQSISWGLARQLLTLLEEEKIKELDLFIEEIKNRADTISPNLLLNEIINYKYDRLQALKQPKESK